MNLASNNSDDFFSLIRDNEEKTNTPKPDDESEIIFRDQDGSLKALRNGEIVVLEPASVSENLNYEPEVKDTDVADEVASATNKSEMAIQKQAIVQPPAVTVSPADKFKNEIAKIISDSGVSFTDQEMRKRFEMLVVSRLKHIRDSIEFKEVLEQPIIEGGMNFTPEVAEKIAINTAVISAEYDRSHLQKEDEQQVALKRKQAFSLLDESSLVKARTVAFPKVKSAPTANVATPNQAKMSLSTTPEGEGLEKKQEEPNLESSVAMRPIAIQTKGKPKVEDVKFEPRLVGPVDEIRDIGLAEFRKLGAEPQTALAKIRSKLALLEEDSYTKFIEGVKAWKQSGVNRIYLEMGQQSLELGKPITEVIELRKKQQQQFLTEQEFDAIIEFNKTLRN